jgi:hypothetical protein
VARAFHRVVAIVLPLLFATSAAMAQNNAQPQQREPVKTELRYDGSEFFRAILHIRGVKPVKEVELSALTNFDDVMVIVLGNPDNRIQQHVNSETPSQMANRATTLGGAVLLSTSHACQFFRNGRGDRITGFYVECSDPEKILSGNLHDCPLVVPARQRKPNAVREIFNGDGKEKKKLERVAAGMPSYFDVNQQSLETLAYFPKGTHAKINLNIPTELEIGTPFAVGADLSDPASTRPFRFLAFASSKVFSNGLLYLSSTDKPEDQTDNLELCFRTIDYLQGPNQQRKRCVFFENGRIVDHFDDLARATAMQKMPLPSINMGALQKDLIDKGNSLIDGLQKDDAPNRLANKLLPLKSLALILLWAISISACLFMFRKLVRSRKPSNTPPAPTIAGATSNPPGVFERRQKELLRRNNVYETVRDLVREFFASVGIQGEPGARLPKIKVARVVRKPDSLRLAIKDLWRLAYGQPQAVSVAQWRDQEPYFERVRQAHEDGKWAFAYETVS